jgi:4-hydroxy-3-methylbut-2-enyl diphosphate reductase
VGSPNSSNSNRLREVAEQQGVAAYMVDNASELKSQWVTGKRVVGVTAGASAPEVLVKQVVEKLRKLGGGPATESKGIAEKVVFPLPKGLA